MNNLEFQQRVSASSKPILIDFWASWCGPCMKTKPILEKLAEEYEDDVEFIPINADDSRELLEEFGVLGIPTVITLRQGEEVGRITGAQSEENYRKLFQALAEGTEVKMPLMSFDRLIRLGAGALFVLVGILTQSWLITGLGGLIAFLGVYDRCPIFNAITRALKRA